MFYLLHEQLSIETIINQCKLKIVVFIFKLKFELTENRSKPPALINKKQRRNEMRLGVLVRNEIATVRAENESYALDL